MDTDHKSLYKTKGLDHQEKRRREILSNQQSQRESLLDEYRKTVAENDQHVKKFKHCKRRNDFANMLMLSEWLVQVPCDYTTSWKFIMCPEGHRCLLVAQKGITLAVSKRGIEFAKWETPLPGGNAKQPGVTTILDCIYSNAMRRYYVLDILHWADIPFVGTEMSFRQFWIQSHLKDELPELSEMRYSIVPLDAYSFSKETLEDISAKYPYFNNNMPKVDGVLFYHQDAFYTQGRTPLVGWLKAFMIPEVFGVTVANSYYDDRPEGYVNYVEFIKEFDEQYAKKHDRRRKIVDCEMSEPDNLVDVELEQ